MMAHARWISKINKVPLRAVTSVAALFFASGLFLVGESYSAIGGSIFRNIEAGYFY